MRRLGSTTCQSLTASGLNLLAELERGRKREKAIRLTLGICV